MLSTRKKIQYLLGAEWKSLLPARKAIELLCAVGALALAASAATVLPQQEQVAAYVSLDGVCTVAYRGGGADHIYLQTFSPTGSSGTGTASGARPWI